ncbi:MAG: tRNA (5-methylaminomethyl-2-thiouridylate)-methyltransferase [Clostridia bacterium]|nr:tRNA (5-methylaminomethyl-2-thiouridylate)-methyltransferase [Clostridia bacterium]
MKKRVVIGMSGGVDSSVGAYLLKEQGYDVIGITMQIWQDMSQDAFEREGGCCSLSAVDDARRVCDKIDIPFYVVNFKEIFEKRVIDYFVDEYFTGRTPNPCIACNRYIKFDALLEKARALEADYVATGHYARVGYDEKYKRYVLKKSATIKKDQTYALYNLTQEQLSATLMPLGDYTKEQVREIAHEQHLGVASKPDSQEICFVEDDNYARFLTERRPEAVRPGYFVDTRGNILGEHKGIVHYTVGQRKGLGIAFGKPMFVVELIPDRNLVVLGDETEVFSKELIANDVNLILYEKLDKAIRVKAKIRYSAQEADCIVEPLGDDRVKVTFDEPQRAITPGQSVVFYDGDYVVGGGIIEK